MTEKYNILIRIIHWLTAICIIGLIVAGYFMTELGKEDTLLGLGKWDIYGLHKSFGVLIIGLFILRVILRLATKIPKLPDQISKTDKKLAHLGHLALYALMIAIPVSGFVMSQAGGYGVKFFGYELPILIEKNKEIGGIAHELHEILPYVIAGIIAIHVFAVIKHIVKDKVNLLKRMF